MSQDLTYSEVSSHSTKKDLYLVIHDKVYNTTSFVDEHPYVFFLSSCHRDLFSPCTNNSFRIPPTRAAHAPPHHPVVSLHLTPLFIHSGGEEVLLDVGGQDATEAFEDVGHSDEAREVLEGLLIGNLKRVPGDPAPKTGATDKIAAGPGGRSDSGTGSGVLIYAVLVLGALAAYVAYGYVQNQDSK